MTSEQLRLAIIKEVLRGKLTRSKDAIDYKPIDDELFDMYQIPASWDIVSLDECCYIHARIGWQALRKEEHQATGDYLLITGTDFKNGFVDYGSCVYVSKERYDMDEKIQLRNDDILITKDGSIGKVAVVKNLPKPATLNAGVFVIRPDDRFEKRYIEYLFQCSYFNHFVNLVKSGTTIKHLNQNKLLKFKIPVPTIDEQNEIVDVLDELLPYVDKFDSIDKELDKLNDAFPNALKKSILHQAVMGKLVPQDPNDEPTSVLLEQIRAEKQALIKSGKLKKDKHESIIYRRDNSHYEKQGDTERCIDDELPFDIPDSWVWMRLKNVGITQTGNTPSKAHPEYFGSDIPFIGPGDIQNANINYCNQGLSTSGKEYGRVTPKGSILQVCIGGSIGKSAIALEDVAFNQQINAIIPIVVDSDYLYFVMTSPYYINYMKENAGGTATPIINRGLWDNLLVPIPPLNEQHRIVEKTYELFPLCDELQ